MGWGFTKMKSAKDEELQRFIDQAIHELHAAESRWNSVSAISQPIEEEVAWKEFVAKRIRLNALLCEARKPRGEK